MSNLVSMELQSIDMDQMLSEIDTARPRKKYFSELLLSISAQQNTDHWSRGGTPLLKCVQVQSFFQFSIMLRVRNCHEKCWQNDYSPVEATNVSN